MENDEYFTHMSSVKVEQDEDNEQSQRDYDLQSLRSALHIFILPVPDQVVSRRNLHLLGYNSLQVLHIASDVPSGYVDKDIPRQFTLFAPVISEAAAATTDISGGSVATIRTSSRLVC